MNLNEKQLQELETIILELPTKYGIQLLNFFNKVKQDNTTSEAKPTLPQVEAE